MTSQSSWWAQTESQLGLKRKDLSLVQTLSPHQQNRLVSTTLRKARMILYTTTQWTWSETRRRRKKRRSCTSHLCGLPARSSHLQNRGELLPVSLSLCNLINAAQPSKARRPIEQSRIPPPPTNAIRCRTTSECFPKAEP